MRHAYASHKRSKRSATQAATAAKQRLSAESSDRRSHSAISAVAAVVARVRLSPSPFVQRPPNARPRRNARPTPCFICASRRVGHESRSLVLLASRRRVARFRTSRLANAKRPQQSRVAARQVRACLSSQSGAGYCVSCEHVLCLTSRGSSAESSPFSRITPQRPRERQDGGVKGSGASSDERHLEASLRQDSTDFRGMCV